MAEERPQFHDWLKGHARGTLDDEATVALAQLVEAVNHHGKKGTLTMQLVVEPAGSGGRTVTIAGKLTAKPPIPAPEVGIFYVGDAGSLHRDDPYAARIPGVPYRDTAGEIKVVDHDGEVRALEPAEIQALAPAEAPRPLPDLADDAVSTGRYDETGTFVSEETAGD